MRSGDLWGHWRYAQSSGPWRPIQWSVKSSVFIWKFFSRWTFSSDAHWLSHTFAFTQTTGCCELIIPLTDVVGIGGITIKLLRNVRWTFTTLKLNNTKRFLLRSCHLRYSCCQSNKTKESYPITRTTATIVFPVAFEPTHNFLRLIWVII